MASKPRLSFADDMWEGIETIKDKTEVGLKSCRDVLEFFKSLASLEEDHSKSITKLLQRYQPASTTNLTLSQGWKGVISVLEGQVAVHKGLSTNLLTNLVHPLQALLKDMENRRKQLVADGTKQKTELRDHSELVKKAKLRYEKLSKELESSRNELLSTKASITDSDPQTLKISRLEKKISASEVEASQSETQYKQQVQQSNSFLDVHQREKWPYILREFEHFEITRISFMKSNIHNFMGLLQDMPAVLEAEVTNGLKAAEKIDPDLDVQYFIEANKTPKEILQPFVFEQFHEKLGINRSPPTATPLRPISLFLDNIRLLGTKEEVKPPSVFGVSLLDLMDKQQKDEPELLVPKVLVAITEGIITQNGMGVEGIFRLNSSPSEVLNVRRHLDKGDYNVTAVTTDVHVLGTVLKQFLRELPEAVIPTSLYEDCVSNQITPLDLLGKLPTVHKNVLLYMINFLQIFMKPEYVKFNKMNSVNLATIFATILLRSPQKEPTALLAGLTNELGFIERLLSTAPPPDVSMFPILASLHCAAPSPSLSSTPPPTNPPAASLAPLSPSNFSNSSSGEVGMSPSLSLSLPSPTDPPSFTSFEEMSSKGDDQISDFSETDHFADEENKDEKDDGRESKEGEREGKDEDKDEGKGEGKENEGERGNLGASAELPEFVFVPATTTAPEVTTTTPESPPN